jgi:predicted esterase
MLVGFHGYGQNAEILLEDLRRIPGAAHWTLVSVQALHRFYNAKTRAIAASWMTSQDREQAMADNLAYLTRVITELRAEGRTGKLAFAGFSQGAAMAWRAAAHLPCQGLLVLGGDLPRDVAEAPALHLPPILIGRGAHDTFYTESHLEQDLAVLASLGKAVEVIRFEGGHEWGPTFLKAAGRFLAGL